jgi:hypothetical protein
MDRDKKRQRTREREAATPWVYETGNSARRSLIQNKRRLEGHGKVRYPACQCTIFQVPKARFEVESRIEQMEEDMVMQTRGLKLQGGTGIKTIQLYWTRIYTYTVLRCVEVRLGLVAVELLCASTSLLLWMLSSVEVSS